MILSHLNMNGQVSLSAFTFLPRLHYPIHFTVTLDLANSRSICSRTTDANTENDTSLPSLSISAVIGVSGSSEEEGEAASRMSPNEEQKQVSTKSGKQPPASWAWLVTLDVYLLLKHCNNVWAPRERVVWFCLPEGCHFSFQLCQQYICAYRQSGKNGSC